MADKKMAGPPPEAHQTYGKPDSSKHGVDDVVINTYSQAVEPHSDDRLQRLEAWARQADVALGQVAAFMDAYYRRHGEFPAE